MFVERKINSHTGAIELWECEWEYPPGEPAKKTPLRMIGEEQPLEPTADHGTAEAICWMAISTRSRCTTARTWVCSTTARSRK